MDFLGELGVGVFEKRESIVAVEELKVCSVNLLADR